MDRNIVTKTLTFVILAIIVTLAIWLCGSQPIAAYLLPFIIAVCFTLIALWCGNVFAVAGLVIVSVLSYLFTKDILSSLFGATVIAATGVVLGYLIQKRSGLVALVITAGAGFLISNGGYLLLINVISGVNPVSSFIQLLQPSMVSGLEQSLIQMGLQDYASKAVEVYQQFAQTVLQMFPAIIIISSACMGYFVLLLNYIVMAIFKSEYQIQLRFSKFKADATTVIIFFLAIMATFFLSEGVVATVFYNIYMILLFVLQICGLSLVDHFLKYRWNWPLVLRIVGICFVFFLSCLPLVSAALLIVAAIDSRRDFRKLNIESKDDREI